MTNVIPQYMNNSKYFLQPDPPDQHIKFNQPDPPDQPVKLYQPDPPDIYM